MKILISKLLLSAGIVTMTLSGCGSTGAQSETATSVSSGTVAKVVARTTDSQVTVNNVTFATFGAAVTVNGAPAALADLKQGMQASISGAINGSNGSASKIEIEGELAGIVEQVNAPANSMILLGRTVAVHNQTVFEGVSGLGDISAGQTVEVYGLSDAAGVVIASRIELKNQSGAEYLSGAISNINPATRTFTIRNITVDYDNAKLPAHPLGNDLTVKVRGSYNNGVLLAESIRVRHPHPQNGHVEIEGLVTSFDDVTDTFTLNDLKVQFSATTKFLHGTKADLSSGVKVEVKGEVDKGVLIAIKIEIDHEHGSPLVTPPAVPSPPSPPASQATSISPGKTLYDINCAGCHNLGTYDSIGFAPNLSGKGSIIASKLSGGHNGISLGSQQISDIIAFVNTN